MPVIMKDNFQYAYTTKGTVFHTLSNAEYEALSEEEKMNGDVYCIPDREPVINPDQLWEKVGTGTLDIGDDLTDGVNQLNSRIVEQKAGSIVVNNSNTSYATFMTLAQIKTLFNNDNLIAEEIILTATNGDFSYNSIWIIGTAWVGNNLTIRFDSNMTKNLRVNYVISIIG